MVRRIFQQKYQLTTKSLDIQESPRVSLALHLLNHLRAIAMSHSKSFLDLSSILAASFKPFYPLSRTSTSSYSRRGTGWCHKKQKDPRDRVTVRVSIEIWDSCRDLCNIMYVQKGRRRLLLNKMPGHNVLCGAAQRARSLQCSKWIFSFCTEFFPHSLTRGKNSICPEKKTVLSPGKIQLQVPDCLAGADREGRAGRAGWGQGQDRAGQGWGAEGRACSCVYVRRNRLECRFGAVCWGKKLKFFIGFFPWGTVTGFSPRYTGFFPRKKSGKFEGKIRHDHRWC